MLGKTGLSLATSPYPFGYELSRFFLFQFSTINFFFSVEAKTGWDERERDEGKIAERTEASEDHEAKKSGEFQGRGF